MTDQEYLDRCAIEAMSARMTKYGLGGMEPAQNSGETYNSNLARYSYDIASAMLAERKKRMEGEKMKSTEECGDCGFQLVMCPKHDKAMQEWRKE